MPFVASVIALGCRVWSSDAATDDGGTTTSGGQTTVATAATAGLTQPSETWTSSSDGDPTAPGYAIIDEPDVGGWPCDLWANDCPPGFKCMPWSDDRNSSWNSVRCSPIADEPKRPGEPCTVVDSWVSGLDDCELGAMCWDVDPETLIGRCVAQCIADEHWPTCADPCTSCAIYGDGVVLLCFPSCDPLVQDCGAGESCVPIHDSFECIYLASSEQGAIGDPCEFLSVCDPSLFCASADAVPNCDSDIGCCAPFCDLSAPDDCAALLPGTSCVPWYADGGSPDSCFASRGIIGACLLPD